MWIFYSRAAAFTAPDQLMLKITNTSASAALASFFYVTNPAATFVDNLFGEASAILGSAPTA